MFPFSPIVVSLLIGGLIGCHTSVAPAIAFVGALVFQTAWRFSARRTFGTIWLFTSLFCLGMVWQDLCWNRFLDIEIGRFASETAFPAYLEVIPRTDAVELPAEADVLSAFASEATTKFTADVCGIRDGRTWRNANGHLTVVIQGKAAPIHSGSRLRIVGLLSREAGSRNPGEISRADLARTSRRLCRLTCNHANAVVRLRSPKRLCSVDRFRTESAEILRYHLGEPCARLASALLLGQRSSLEQTRQRVFFETGTSHFLAISGLHVGILASAFWFAARVRFLPPRLALVLAMAMSAFYIVLTGSRAPVIRATVFVWFACLGYLLRRRLEAWNFLAAAGAVVFAINATEPFQIGTQLSFLAVAAILGFASLPSPDTHEPLDRLIDGSRSCPIRWMRYAAWNLWLIFRLSLVIWIVTLPLVMTRFHLLTPTAPALNVVLWIPVSLALLSGFAVVVLGWILPPAASVAAIPCWWSLQFMEWSVRQVHAWPFSHFWVCGLEAWALVGYYACAFVLAFNKPNRFPLLALIGMTVAWVGLGQLSMGRQIRSPDWRATPGSLQCTVLSVGHGGCSVLELPDGQVIVYDAGGLGPSRLNEDRISRYLWHARIRRIDLLVISHPDIDHYNAVPGLSERFHIGALGVSRQMFTTMNDSLGELVAAIERRRLPVRTLDSRDILATGPDWRVRVLHPPASDFHGSDNAWSIVLDVEFGSQKILLTGDVEDEGLDHLLGQTFVHYDVLFAPHHGSLQGRPAELLSRFQPSCVVISDGYSPSIDQQCRIYADSGARVLHTARDGAVRIVVQSELSVESWKQATTFDHVKTSSQNRFR